MPRSRPDPWTEEIRFNAVFGIFVLSPDEVEFRTGATSGKSFVVSDSEKRGVLGTIIQKILSPSTLPSRPWNRAESTLLRELMPQLRENGIVNSEGAPPTVREDSGFAVPILQKPLSETRIGIVGHGVLGEAVAALLGDMPCGPITIIESSSVANNGHVQRMSNPRRLVPGTVTPVARPADDLEWIEILKSYDWVIAAQDCFEPEELAVLNKAALQVRVPWSLVCFDGYEGWVGPTFVPGQTACFNCFHRRLFAGAAEPKHVFTEPGVKVYRLPSPWSVVPEGGAWISFIASMFALEVIAAMNGRSFTVNNFLVVHRLSLTFQRESVLRLPRCQACSPVRNAPRSNVFSHILGTRLPAMKQG
jgi:bacteriocin biosynthesis cyclodehydratase domain-containing protein